MQFWSNGRMSVRYVNACRLPLKDSLYSRTIFSLCCLQVALLLQHTRQLLGEKAGREYEWGRVGQRTNPFLQNTREPLPKSLLPWMQQATFPGYSGVFMNTEGSLQGLLQSIQRVFVVRGPTSYPSGRQGWAQMLNHRISCFQECWLLLTWGSEGIQGRTKRQPESDEINFVILKKVINEFNCDCYVQEKH